MGADNQAERVIARIEFREELAIEFHHVFCEHVGLEVLPWETYSAKGKAAVIAGVRAMINKINERVDA